MSVRKERLAEYTKENILEWFKNYKTYCYNINDIAQIKHEFIVGEYRNIKWAFKSPKDRLKLFKFVEEIILKEVD